MFLALNPSKDSFMFCNTIYLIKADGEAGLIDKVEERFCYPESESLPYQILTTYGHYTLGYLESSMNFVLIELIKLLAYKVLTR